MYEFTAGWPALTAITLEWSARRTSLAPAALACPGGPLFSYLTEEVLAAETPGTREVFGRLAAVSRFTAELCRENGFGEISGARPTGLAAGVRGVGGRSAAVPR
ncbi:hypothetical protein ACFWY9_10565 [Amycolatopsis sp. NPDC059027]|uniref:hypothetical protein n=1 Tax=Amycolatopsis sp. NPDC059027 TaxID=3346709 RepID=UPI00366FE61B